MLSYDENIAKKWREKAVTKAEDLVIGGIYYLNETPESQDDSYKLLGFTCENRNDAELFTSPEKALDSALAEAFYFQTPIVFMAFEATSPSGGKFVVYRSLKDTNVGASYNPWFLFESKDDMLACYKELEIEYIPSKGHDYV